MSAALTIRPLRLSDRAQWAPLWDGYNAFYGNTGPKALDPAITELAWQRFFDAAEPMHALVAEKDGRLLGLAHIIYHRSTNRIMPTCYLQDLFTAEAARGKGVGRALIDAVYAHAKAAGGSRVYWLTHETNATAMQLYDNIATKSSFVQYVKNL